MRDQDRTQSKSLVFPTKLKMTSAIARLGEVQEGMVSIFAVKVRHNPSGCNKVLTAA